MMHPATTERGKFWNKKFNEGMWRWAAFLAIYFTSGVSGLFLPRLLDAPSSYPGSDPPWYFIRQDFFQGLGDLAGVFAMLVILAFTWRRYTFSNWLLLIAVCGWMVPGIVTGIVIYWRCGDFFNYGHATSAWPTFAAYSRSGVEFVGIPVALGLVLLSAVLMIWRSFRERQNAA